NARRRRDPLRARTHETARMRERVILLVSRDRPGPRIDRDHSAAIATPAQVWSVRLVEREVPEEHALRPASGRPDDQRARVPDEVVGPVGRPLATGAFREVHLLLRKRVMYGRLRRDVAVV